MLLARYSPSVLSVSDINDPNYSSIVSGGNLPICGIQFLATGEIQEDQWDSGGSPTWATVGYWADPPPSDPGNYELNFTVDSEDNGDPGTWSGATRGSYIDLDATRTFQWQKDANGIGTANSEVTATVRYKPDNSISASVSNLSYDAECTA